MKKNIIQTTKIIVLGLVLSLGVGYISAFTAPVSSPPTCVSGNPGCDAPINAGPTAQTKNGPLTIGGLVVPTPPYKLDVPGLASFQGVLTQTFSMPTGAGVGKVLTSDATGNATWKTGTDFSTGGEVYDTTIFGNGNATHLTVAPVSAQGAILNITKNNANCSDLKIEFYRKHPDQSIPADGITIHRYVNINWLYLGYGFGGTGDGYVRQIGQVVTLPVADGKILLKSNTNRGTPCALRIYKIADIY